MPPWTAPYLFSLITSGLMSLMVSGIATYNALGPIDGFVGAWLSSWSFAWAVAFPILLVVAPLVRRVVGSLVRAPGE